MTMQHKNLINGVNRLSFAQCFSSVIELKTKLYRWERWTGGMWCSQQTRQGNPDNLSPLNRAKLQKLSKNEAKTIDRARIERQEC